MTRLAVLLLLEPSARKPNVLNHAYVGFEQASKQASKQEANELVFNYYKLRWADLEAEGASPVDVAASRLMKKDDYLSTTPPSYSETVNSFIDHSLVNLNYERVFEIDQDILR